MELGFLVLLLIVCFIVVRFLGKDRSRRYAECGTVDDVIQACSACPQDFEAFCAGLFKHAGYSVKVTPKTQDGGYDLWMKKGNITYIGECKLYTDTVIGRPLLQKLVGANATQRADKCVFITTSTYSKPAIEYAREQKIWLIDKTELQKMMNKYL